MHAIAIIPPPEGYSSWLDFAVESFDTRALLLSRMFDGDPGPTADAMRDAARAELWELRGAAAARGTADLVASGEIAPAQLAELERILSAPLASNTALQALLASPAPWERRDEGLIGRSAASDPNTVLLEVESMGSATEFARRLGVSDETIYQREGLGELFSVHAPAGARGRCYPLFQVHPAIAGSPLREVLSILKSRDGAFLGGAQAYLFFATSANELAFLTPVELLVGAVTGKSAAADALSRSPHARRLQIVKNAARTFADVANA